VTATKGQRHQAILALVNRGGVHTQQELAEALARRGLVRGYRSSTALVRELVLSVELIEPMAVIRTPPGTANLVARRIDEAALPGIAGTVAGDDTIIAVLRKPGAGRALKDLLAHVE